MLESQDVLKGELVLPSGMTLPLGAMIVALRRKQVMKEILQVGRSRESKGLKEERKGFPSPRWLLWMHVASMVSPYITFSFVPSFPPHVGQR